MFGTRWTCDPCLPPPVGACADPAQNELVRCTPYSGGVVKWVGSRASDCTPETAATEFRGIAIPNLVDSVVAVTSAGDIWSSTNRGDTWKRTTLGTPLNAVTFAFRQDHGVVVGDGGRILRTADSGSTWFAARSNPVSSDLYAAVFVGDLTVFACGAAGVILRSNDRGETWSQVLAASAALRSIYFASPLNGLCVGDGGTVLRTTDGGESWTSVPGMLGDGRSATPLLSVDAGRSFLWKMAIFNITTEALASVTPPVNEVQRIWMAPSVTSGTFTLRFSPSRATTPALPFNCSAAALQAALEALQAIGVGGVVVTGGPLPTTAINVEFIVRFSTAETLLQQHATNLAGGTEEVVPSVTRDAVTQRYLPQHAFRAGLIVRAATIDQCPPLTPSENLFPRSWMGGENSVGSSPGFVCRNVGQTCFAQLAAKVSALSFLTEREGYWSGFSQFAPLSGPNHHENRSGDTSPYTLSTHTVGPGMTIKELSLTRVADDGCNAPALNLHLEWTQTREPPTNIKSLFGTWILFELTGGPHVTVLQGEKLGTPRVNYNFRFANLTRPGAASHTAMMLDLMGYIKFTSTPGLLSGALSDVVYGPGTLGVSGPATSDPPTFWTSRGFNSFGVPYHTHPLALSRIAWWNDFGDWLLAVPAPHAPFLGDFVTFPNELNHRRPGTYTMGFAVAVVGRAVGDYVADILIDNLCVDWGKATTPASCSRFRTSYVWNGSGWDVPNSDCLSAFAECVTGYNGDILNLPPAPFVGELRLVPCSIP